jgi:hypothetical protein
MADIPNRQAVGGSAYEQLLDQGYPIKIVELGEWRANR